MLVKVFCDSGATTTAKLNLGQGTPRASNRTASAHSAYTADEGSKTNAAGGAARGAGGAVLALALAAGAAVLALA
jgi:hypothetical protein